MENIEISKRKLKVLTLQPEEAIDQLGKIYSLFRKLTRENDVGVFFAANHILYSSVRSIKSESEPEYLEAINYLETLKSSEYFEMLKSYWKDFGPIDLINANSTLYENSLGAGEKNKLGAFYTPVEYCQKAIKKIQLDHSLKKAYDPFCGGGAWLCAHILSKKLVDTNTVPVFGTDIDRIAVILARLNVSMLLPSNILIFRLLQAQIRVADSLYSENEDEKMIMSFMNSCDGILTNPPYGFAVDAKNKNYKTTLSRIPDREVFYYAIDKVRVSLSMNKPAYFLVPNTFIFNLGAKSFKSHIVEKYNVNIYDHTNDDIFATATVRTALLGLMDKLPGNEHVFYSKNLTDEKTKINLNNFVEGQTCSSTKSSFLTDSILLNDLFEVSQGLIPYDKYRGHTHEQISNRVYHANKKVSILYKKELQGKDVSPFSVQWNKVSWIKYGDWLAAPRHPKFFKHDRLLVREITNSKTGQIYCAFTQDEFYNTPSLINVICRESVSNKERTLKTLAVLMSSSAYSKYHLENSPKSKKGLFPKILVNDVRNLPLPSNFLKMDFSKVYGKAEKMSNEGVSMEKIIDYIDECILGALPSKRAA